jgi:hypothetical protein
MVGDNFVCRRLRSEREAMSQHVVYVDMVGDYFCV